MDTEAVFSKCVFSEQLHAHGTCAQCTFSSLESFFCVSPLLFTCVLCFSRCTINPVTILVIIVIVFLRADEIEMLMTDLERANQVTCPAPLCIFVYTVIQIVFHKRLARFYFYCVHKIQYTHLTEIILCANC